MESPKFPCSRYGGSNMLFNESRINNRTWWKRLFEIMVKEVSVPPHLCFEVLKEIFPHKILECICTIMGIEEKPPKLVVSDENIQVMAEHFLQPNYVTAFKLNEKLSNLNTTEPKETSKFSKVLRERDMRMNAYLNFRRKKHQKIISDKPLKLSVAAKIITEKIAHDFVKWLKDIEKNVQNDIVKIFKLFNISFAFQSNEEDSDSPTDNALHAALQKRKSKVSKPVKKRYAPKKPKPENAFEYNAILEMFEIGLRNEATTSIVVDMKEIPITGLKKVFEYSEEEAALLKRKQEKAVMHYFQTLIPNPPVEYRKSNLVEKLDSMEVTFKDITHLRSVKSYCKWLLDHPDKEKPTFLKMENMFDIASLSKSDESIEIIDKENIF